MDMLKENNTQQKKSKFSLFINRYAKKVVICELIILIVSAAFFIKCFTVSFTPNVMPDVWTIYNIIMTIWFFIAIAGALSLPILIIQFLIFLLIKTERTTKKMNVVLIIFSIITFMLFFAYVLKNYSYMNKNRIREHSEYVELQ